MEKKKTSYQSHHAGSGSPKKINQALELLSEAVEEKRNELYQALEQRYDDFRHLIDQVAGTMKEKAKYAEHKTKKAIRASEEKIEQAVSQTAEEVDRKIHERPWLFLGSVAVTGFVVGYRLASRDRENSGGQEDEEKAA